VKAIAVLVLGIALWLPCNAAPAGRLLDGVGFDQRIGARLPLETPFADESGAPVRLQDFVGPKPVLLMLVDYDCRNLCGTMLGELAARLRDLDLRAGHDFQVLVASFDPRETPAIARAKKARYPLAAGAWHFLTGTPQAIGALTRTLGFRYKPERNSDGFVHPAGAVIVTPEGQISRYLFALDPDNTALRYGLIAASGHRLGTPVDRLWLLCHRFDPASGRYTSLVTGFERALGFASVAALAALIAWLARRGHGGA
jgi:protein SCO1/2